MDPGLVTSERGPHRRDTIVAPYAGMHSAPTASPSITCRSCRVQIPLDDIDNHECDPKDIKAAMHSPRTPAVTQAATRAANFLDSFLESCPVKDSPATQSQHPKDPNGSVRKVETVEASINSSSRPPPVVRYDSLPQLPSPTESANTSKVDASDSYAANHLSRLGRSLSLATSSAVSPPTSPTSTSAATAPVSPLASMSTIFRSASSHELLAPIQSRVRGVRLSKNRVALYSIVSNLLHVADTSSKSPTTKGTEIIVERRYREFYTFALAVFSMFPSTDLWQRLPPKTYCSRSNNLSDGFLLRRKTGLDDFVRCALEKMNLGSNADGSIAQWYLVRKFLNLPPTLGVAPTKDRSLIAAVHELTKHARQSTPWSVARNNDDLDTTFEKMSDGFLMVKRVKTCPFPARAVFDMVNWLNAGNLGQSTTPGDSILARSNSNTEVVGSDTVAIEAGSVTQTLHWNPMVEHVEFIRRENRHTWTERVVLKGRWNRAHIEMVSLKSWKVDDTGSIIIVAIPADVDDVRDPRSDSSFRSIERVDCILGGWIITPIAGEETCTVTWIMQANFGECNAHNEFHSGHGITNFIGRGMMIAWADEIVHLLQALEKNYDPAHYRNLGPVLSGEEFQKLKLERHDTTSSNVSEDPRVYTVAHEMEPGMCLLVHKNTNTNVLIFKANQKTKLDLDIHTPLKAEWIMFEKVGNPRQDLSAIERKTTYEFSVRHIGPNVFHFTLDLIRRDCVLRYDPIHGFGLFTTINGQPNMLLKRIYLKYAKASRLSFAKIEEITLVGSDELELITNIK